ncbi:MAG: hypothetical protein ACOVQK_00695 [Cyanobium sp.]
MESFLQDGNPKCSKIETQAEADGVPRNVTIGFYGPIRSAKASSAPFPLGEGNDFDDEFGDNDEDM